MKKQNHNNSDSPEKKQYKKRYILRKIEEKESQDTIASFSLEKEQQSVWQKIVEDFWKQKP